jgi:hypothetical protein
MSEKRTTARAFHDAVGVEDWRVLFSGAHAAALEAGGRLADDTHVPHWWTLASPENHGVDIAAWPDFENDEED